VERLSAPTIFLRSVQAAWRFVGVVLWIGGMVDVRGSVEVVVVEGEEAKVPR